MTEGKVNSIDELKKRKIWVCFKILKSKEKGKKDRKIPVQVNGKAAKINDPGTWDTYENCKAAVKAGKAQAFAFAIKKDLDIVGIDLDLIYDKDGNIEPWAQDIIEHTKPSLCEDSISLKGKHILVIGTLPAGRRHTGKVEMYDDNRFFIFTEYTAPGRTELVAGQKALEYVYEKYVKEEKHSKQTKLTAAAKDKKKQSNFALLWQGNWDGAQDQAGNPYPSISEAVAGLCGMISKQVDSYDQLDQRFRQSKLYAEYERLHPGKYERDKKYLFPKLSLSEYAGNYTKFTGQPARLKCGEWLTSDAGVSIFNERTQDFETACPHPILPLGVVVDFSAERVKTLKPDRGTKVKLAFKKSHQPWIYVMVEKSIVSSNNKILELTKFNIDVDSDTAKNLVRYISTVLNLNRDLPVTTAVKHYGWHGAEFAPYSNKVEVDTEKFGDIVEAMTCRGTADEWIKFYKPLIESCLPLRLVLDASIASVLIEPVNLQSFCLHVWGGTEFGKTTILQIAASIWGKPTSDGGNSYLMSLSSTMTALLSRAATLQSMPLCADERQAVDRRYGVDINTFIMQFCGELNRGRGSATGHELQTRTWKSVALTTGEQPFLDARTGGGAANRVIELPVNEPLFKVDTIRQIKSTLKTQYGTIGQAVVKLVQESLEDLVSQHAGLYKELEHACLAYTGGVGSTSKQLNAGAAILLADYMLSVIAGIDKLKADILALYLKSKPEVDAANRAAQVIQAFLASNKNKILSEEEEHEQDERIPIVVGKYCGDGGVYLIKNKLDEELEKYGFDFAAVAAGLARLGYIATFDAGKRRARYTLAARVGAANKVLCVKILNKQG